MLGELTICCQSDASSSHEALERPKANDESSRHDESLLNEGRKKNVKLTKSHGTGHAKKKLAW